MRYFKLFAVVILSYLIVRAFFLPVNKSAIAMVTPPPYEFWAVIEAAKAADPDLGFAYPDGLKQLLLTYNKEEVTDFHEKLQTLMAESYQGELWGAAYVINGGCSDDCFEYFRQFVIANGKAFYELAMTRPDDLGEHIPYAENIELEGLTYAVTEAFMQKHGITDFELVPKGPNYPEIDFKWNEDNLETKYPKLAAKYMG